MNKLFTKVAALTLGVAMAAGVGVALGSAKASEAKADDPYYSLVPEKTGTNSYASEATPTIGGIQWSVYGNSDMIPWRIGGKNTTNTDRTVSTKTAMGATISKIAFNYAGVTAGKTTNIVINSIMLTVASDSGFSSVIDSHTENTSSTLTITNSTSSQSSISGGTFEFVPTSPLTSWAANSYYKFTINYKTTANGGSVNNSFISLSGIDFYGQSTKTQYNVTDSVEHGSVSPSKVDEGATLTATITPDAGYKVPETVSVTMGGVAATHTYQNGVVTVENVTGDIVITGTCAALPTPTHAGTSDDPYTVADAILAIDASVTGTKYVTGVVNEIVTPYDSGYKNITFNFVDNTTDTAFIQAFRCGGTEAANVAIGDTVVVSGSLLKYGSKYELDSGCQIVSRVSPQVDTKYTVTFNSNGGTDPAPKEVGEGLVFTFPSAGTKDGNVFKGWTNDGGAHYYQENDTSAPVNADTTYTGEWQTKGTETDPYNVARARLAITYNAGVRGVYTTGIVKEIVTPYDSQYKNITFNIVDAAEDTDYLQVFRCKGDDASKVAVGDIVVVSGNLKLHDSTPEYDANCVLQSLVTPVTDWTDAQKAVFTAQLDGYVPPYFAELSGDIEVSGTLVQYNVKSDVVAAFNSYYEQQGWESEVAGYWSHETTGGNGVVQAYAQTSATGALLSFQYTEYAVVTLDENGTKTEVKLVPPADYTLPSPTASLIPDGKEFKAWEIAGVEYQPEAKVSVSEDVTITAVYVDKVQTDWTDAQKEALETALHGYLPPFFGELAEEITTTENSARFTVSGDVSDQFATKLGDGWELIGTNTYMKTGDGYYLTASIYVEGVRLPVGDYSYISFEYHEGSTWSAALLNQFATVLHGVVPSYDDSVSTLAYVPNYNDFEMPATTDQETAKAQLDTLCAGWTYYESGSFYYTFSQDQLGYARGYVYYDEEDQSYSATLVFVQTAYDEEQQDAFYDKLGVIPPFFNNFPTYTFYETDGMFVTDQITYLSYLSNYQQQITGNGFTLIGQSAGQRYVKIAEEALDGTVYAYAAQLQDGGLLVVEIFTFYDYYLSLNIYYQAMPVSIALSGEYKTTFEYGEQLDTTGMVVTATMSDETEQDVTSSAQFSGFDSLVEGEQTVTVTVGNASATYTVTVKEKVLQSIAVTSEPTKVVYKVGEEFDPEGLEVSATYNGGDPVVLDLADVEISGFDSSTTGEKTVTVAFGGKTASFTVTVELAYDADAFAKDLLEMVAPICANYDGKKNNKAALKTVWDTMSQRYSTLSNEEKAKVIAAAAKADGTDLEKAMAFYNYACKKYGLTKFIEGRQVKALVTEHETGNSILPIVVIVASSVAAITAIGVVIALKRRKALLAK